LLKNLSFLLERLKTLSFLATGLSSPNPPVAAVITDLEGNILAEGHTQVVGQNHAEREAYSKLNFIPPHYLFVTLEPCSHTGKTPPCLDLVLKYRPKKVFLGLKDPNPLVRARDSIEIMQKNGIEVEFLGELSQIAHSFLGGFLQRVNNKRPSYILKSAVSKEGYFCSENKFPVHLTNPKTDNLFQALRAKVDAILVGPKTVYTDRPRLNYRGYKVENLESLEFPIDPFWNTLVKSVYTSSFVSTPSLQTQPYRIFCLSSKYSISENFLITQMKINEQTNTEKIIFLLLDKLPTKEIKKLDKLKAKIFPINSDSFIKELNKYLLELGVNNLLVEGGNFLYSLFSPYLNLYDSIILIQTLQSIPKGESPNFPNSLSILEKFNIDNDIIYIYKKF